MSATPKAVNESTEEEIEIQYGDTFRHIITGEEHTVHDIRDGKVTWTNGGWDDIEDLRAAVNGDGSLYEPVSVGSSAWEGDGYGSN